MQYAECGICRKNVRKHVNSENKLKESYENTMRVRLKGITEYANIPRIFPKSPGKPHIPQKFLAFSFHMGAHAWKNF